MDALGVTHLVACINHTHEESEVNGLSNDITELWHSVNEKQEELTFDSTPTANSTNPVTSGGVKAALDAKQDALTFDTTPTANSTNPVTSGGVKAALDAKYSINQVDENDEQEAHLKAIAEDDDVYFKFQLKNGDTEKQVLLTVSKMDNFARAISNPDSAPAASSDNLITSGAVADALSGKANTNHTHSYNENGLYVHLYTKNAGDNPLVAVANTIFNNNGNPYLLHIAVKNNTGNSLAINDMIIGNGTYVIPSETNNSIPDGYIGIIDLYRFTGDSNYYATVSTLFPISA